MILVSGGMMRSGSVWIYQMLREYLTITHSGNAPQMPHNLEEEFMDLNLEIWAGLSFYKLIKLHEFRDSLAPYKEQTRVVMTYRDLRDTALSLMAFRQDHLEGILASKILLRIKAAEERWYDEYTDLGLIYPMSYEGLKLYTKTELRAMMHWLGKGLDLETISEQIVDKWSIKKNKERAKKGLPVGHQDYMAERHIASGEVERWRKEFKPEEWQRIVDQVGADWFEAHGYDLE